MTRAIINGCLETGCKKDGGLRLLCDEHAPSYDEPLRGDLTDDVDPDSREEPA